ncbi:MAG: NAD(P)-binding domain-containing protein [Methanomicrobiaceae archaeon]|nr:NAD(P)-binding domain-containing protein [Methanomicrobiaceae archaeon]MDD5418474.1 NAD(P)-binding domain-containing protein [Methanomicrobiaceae archaeon]
MHYYPDASDSLSCAEVIRAIEDAFAEHGRGNVQMPPKIYLTFEKGDLRTMPAYMPGLDLAGVKLVNVHPRNPDIGLPTVMAVTVILDVETGLPEAIINATALTDMRTGAAGAVAAKYLAVNREVRVGFIGSGRQAHAQLAAIADQMDIREIRVWSRTAKRAESFAAAYARYDAQSVSLERACDCDILVTTTPSRRPLVKAEWVHEGTHINAIGADAPGKQELDPALLKRSLVFVDDIEQAVHSGEINVPISQGLYAPEEIAGTLGEVVLGLRKRTPPDAITIFDSTGLAIQDLAIARIAMENVDGIALPFP